ncbi:MAG TPA: glycosyltransferase family 2 protein [Candidatus Krumholzibacteria bacterium]|nr:glycosyltransferase family 2 protein [Candidatus Krumholzibacteria bacterium]
MSGPYEFAVVIPCFNEEDAVGETLEKLEHSLRGCGPHEVVFVDDGSTDRTSEVLAREVVKYPFARVVPHARNLGYGAALKTGIRRTTAPLIVIADADGTYPFNRIPDLLEAVRSCDMAVGARTGANVTYSFVRKIPKVFMKAYMSWLAGQPIPDMNSGLRVFRRGAVERFLKILPNTFSFTTTVTLAMMRNRYDVTFIPIDYSGRIGKSKIKPVQDTIRFTQLIVRTGMYFAPLRVLLPISVILFLLACGTVAYDVIILDNLTDKSVLLFTSSMNVGIFALLADMIDKRSP